MSLLPLVQHKQAVLCFYPGLGVAVGFRGVQLPAAALLRCGKL